MRGARFDSRFGTRDGRSRTAPCITDPLLRRCTKPFRSCRRDNDVQLSLKSQAVGVASDLGQLRWLLFEQSGTSISAPLLIVVISWLAIIFALGPVRAV